MQIAQARNDGLNRLYTASPPGETGIGEYSFGGSWAKTSNISTTYEVFDIAIGMGKNDSINRIYATVDDHIEEYTCE